MVMWCWYSFMLENIWKLNLMDNEAEMCPTSIKQALCSHDYKQQEIDFSKFLEIIENYFSTTCYIEEGSYRYAILLQFRRIC